YLTLGPKLPGLQRALNERREPGMGPQGAQDADEDFMEARLRKFAAIDSIDQLPTRWFGYQAADVLVLTSGSEDFINRLAADRSGRLDALTEWVRRGGQIVMSAGHNQQFVSELLAKMKLINCATTGTVTRPLLISLPTITAQRLRFVPPGGVEIAKL